MRRGTDGDLGAVAHACVLARCLVGLPAIALVGVDDGGVPAVACGHADAGLLRVVPPVAVGRSAGLGGVDVGVAALLQRGLAVAAPGADDIAKVIGTGGDEPGVAGITMAAATKALMARAQSGSGHRGFSR
jgi:hypothetical protein